MNGQDEDIQNAAPTPRKNGKGNEKGRSGQPLQAGCSHGAISVDLDSRRSMIGRVEAEIRRDLRAHVQSGKAAASRRQEEIAEMRFLRPAETCVHAAEKAKHLLHIFAVTRRGRAPGYRRMIASTREDFARLARKEPPQRRTANENEKQRGGSPDDKETPQ